MELRQLRYLVKILELGSLGRAALELDVGVSALSQQIGKLESELSTRLLNRTPTGDSVCLAQLGNLPLVAPSAQHGLRSTLVTAFERAGVVPNIIMEVDGLAVLMNAVRAGHTATIQPGAAAALTGESGLSLVQIADPHVGRRNLLATLSDDELSPAASFERLLVVLLYFSFFFGMYDGAMVAALTEVMPQNARVVGFSLAFSLATAIFGGFTPAMSTFLVQTTGDKASPAYWLMFAAVCGLSATLVLYRGQKSWVATSV